MNTPLTTEDPFIRSPNEPDSEKQSSLPKEVRLRQKEQTDPIPKGSPRGSPRSSPRDSPRSSSLEIFEEEQPDIEVTTKSILKQVTLPFLISGAVMVFVGLYFDYIQGWTVFKKVPEIIVLIPAILALKGNLEMTLASRLSTQANLGLMDNSKDYCSIFIGNIALMQLQAIAIAFLTCICGTALIYLGSGAIIPKHIVMIFASCIGAIALASFFLAVITGSIIILALSYNINPDNIATPIVASLGDITSLLLISWLASELYKRIDNEIYIPCSIIIAFLLLLPFLGWVAKTNKHTSNIVTSGWTPVIISMLICMTAGITLKHFMDKYKTFPAFEPVMIGVGSNIVSIQASRLSTTLHKKYRLGELPENTGVMISPLKILYAKDSYAVTSRVFLGLAVPGHILFATIIILVRTSFSLFLGSIFLTIYLLMAWALVYILLVSTYILTLCTWKWRVNPDTATIPYLTAIGDLLGILLLGAAYCLLNKFQLSDLL